MGADGMLEWQMRLGWFPGLGLAAAILSAHGASDAQARSSLAPVELAQAASAGAVAPARGRVKVLTYNVAGLPEGLSQSRPVVNLPVIGKLLNRYDVALVQEDFAYPDRLRQQIAHPHGSPPFVRGNQLHFGDGLSQFSRFAFHGYERESWAACHGVVDAYFDCLTPKGFTFARLELAPGVLVDVYNVHMDAGWSELDRRARSAQLAQLARALERRSVGQAVLVGGDFNLTGSEQDDLRAFEKQTGLTDSCRKLGCGEPYRIDRILVRSAKSLRLVPRSWRVDRRFVDGSQRPLSDHLAISVEVEWSVATELPAKTSSAGQKNAGTRPL